MDKFSKAKQLAIFIEFLDMHNAWSKYLEGVQLRSSFPWTLNFFEDYEYKAWIWAAFIFRNSAYGFDFWGKMAIEWEEYCKQFD